MTRICETCRLELPIENFRTIPHAGTVHRRRQCEECYVAKKTPYRRNRHLLKYGLDQTAYEQLLVQQEFRCAICHKHTSELKRILAIDHDHRRNRVRGLLCNSCNGLLGLADDSLITLKAAIEYLLEHSK